MPRPFNPPQPDEMIVIKVSAREAHLIKVLRGCEFGKIVVHKVGGVLVRAEPNESQLLNDESGLDLAVR